MKFVVIILWDHSRNLATTIFLVKVNSEKIMRE